MAWWVKGQAGSLSWFRHVWLCETLWTIVHQAPLSVGFSRREYWTGLPCPPPMDLPHWVKNPPATQEIQQTRVQSLGRKDPLEEDMATHSSILAWKNPLHREAWWPTVHGVAKSRTIQKRLNKGRGTSIWRKCISIRSPGTGFGRKKRCKTGNWASPEKELRKSLEVGKSSQPPWMPSEDRVRWEEARLLGGLVAVPDWVPFNIFKFYPEWAKGLWKELSKGRIPALVWEKWARGRKGGVGGGAEKHRSWEPKTDQTREDEFGNHSNGRGRHLNAVIWRWPGQTWQASGDSGLPQEKAETLEEKSPFLIDWKKKSGFLFLKSALFFLWISHMWNKRTLTSLLKIWWWSKFLRQILPFQVSLRQHLPGKFTSWLPFQRRPSCFRDI